MENICAQWVFDHLDIDADAFWRVQDPYAVLDSDTVIALVAAEHASADFPLLLDGTDPDSDYSATIGRMIGASLTGRQHDWPLDRSWFHYLYIDLARLDGVLGMDLSSDDQLKTATRMYWDCVREFVREMKSEVSEDDENNVDALTDEALEEAMPRTQLQLF